MYRIAQPFKSLAPIFRPPFNGLGLLVVLYYAWCFLVYPHSQTLRGNLPDPDDYMYLVQVLDWLKNPHGFWTGWYDNIQPRINPPDGTLIQFSRLAQIPMALFVLLFEKLGLGPRASSMLMALIYPLLLLGGLMAALRWVAASFVPKSWAGISAYVALFASGMMFLFMPGHVDHHGLIVLLVALALGCALRMMEHPGEYLWGLAAGFVMAFGLTIALEMLPWLLVISACLGFWAAARGGKAAINALAYGLGLYLASLVFLRLSRPPAQWLTVDVLTYSVVYVFLTGGIAINMAGVAAASKMPALVRWLVGGVLAAITGAMFLHRFPALLHGPYGGMDPELVEMILGEVDEAQPLVEQHPSFLALTFYLGPSMLALASALTFMRRAKTGAERWRWGLWLAVESAAIALTTFYQYRFMGIMGLATIIPLTVLLQRGWFHIRTFKEERRKVFAEVGLLLLAGPLFSILYPSLIDGRSFNTGFLLFPVDQHIMQMPCDTYQLEKILANPNIYGDRPRLIMNIMSQGPELIFRTPHQVLAAPYLDTTGNVDAARFFSTPYASEAEAIARRRKIDLVVACRFVPDILTRPPGARHATLTGGAGKDFAPHFVELLMTGKQPDWLKPRRFPSLNNFVIFEFAPPADAPTAPQKSGKSQ